MGRFVTRTARPGPDRRGAGDVRRLRALGPIATPARYDVWGGGYLSVDVLGYSMSAAYDIPKTTHSFDLWNRVIRVEVTGL